MDKALQKKLVGAAVLIALAVIFLPMLLNGKQEPENVTMQIEIPPKPTFDVPNRLEQPRQPAAVVGTPAMVESPVIVQHQPQVISQAAAPVVVAPRPKPAPIKAAPVKPAPVAAAKPARKPAAAPTGAGFVVQVGSFGKQGNAERLQEKLVSQGFPAFVEANAAGGKSIYRVKVGPRTSRNSVDELRIRLLDEAKLEGIIVSHP